MQISELSVPHTYRITATKHRDTRGAFYEQFRSDTFGDAGICFDVAQTNTSVSRRNTLRGIHLALAPGQAKIVICPRGAVLDVMVDLRVGSPTFGRFEMNRLDGESATMVCMAQGIGHAFLALTNDTMVTYLCSALHDPELTLEINPLDPELRLPWGLVDEPVMSDKDRAAPTVAQAHAEGILPTWQDCLDRYDALAPVR
jgi:NDP-hexose 5-epimerase